MFKTKTEEINDNNKNSFSVPHENLDQDGDILSRLLDIEASVASFVFEAQTEADKRISAAKEEAEKEFKAGYDKLVSDFEDEFLKNKEAEDQRLLNIYGEFDSYLASLKKDNRQFDSYLDSCFFGE